MILRLRSEGEEDALALSHRLVALHVAGVLLLIGLVLATAIWMSREHNRLALQSSMELVDNQITALRGRAYTLVKDYSIWNEGYAAVIEDDREWVYSGIGSSVTEIGTFDLAFLVPQHGIEPYGWVGDSPPEGEIGLIPDDLLQAILGLLDQPGPANHWHRTLFAEFRGAPWVFAISRMYPVTGLPEGVTREELPRQIHGLHLTRERLTQIGAETLAGEIYLSDVEEYGRASLPLIDYRGAVISYVTWYPPQPGASILRGAAAPLALALGVATILSAISSFMAVRSARRLEKALHAAQIADRSKIEFFSNVSHELRTPMNGVLGATQLLQMTDLDAEQRELVTVLLSSANAQMSLISDLIDLSRIDAGRLKLVNEPFEPAVILAEIRDMMHVAAAKKRLKLDSEWGELEGAELFGDGRAFRQVVTNLVGNAVKFTEDGVVTVRASNAMVGGKCRILVSVSDTGPGIPEHALDKIFERFYQVDGSMSRSAMGTGLGLAISRRLANLLGGEITVASTVGIGSTFSFVAYFDRLERSVEQHDAA